MDQTQDEIRERNERLLRMHYHQLEVEKNFALGLLRAEALSRCVTQEQIDQLMQQMEQESEQMKQQMQQEPGPMDIFDQISIMEYQPKRYDR